MANFTRRQILKSTIASSLLLSISPIVRAVGTTTQRAEFTAARVWPANAYTRVTLESTLPLKYKVMLLKNPNRLVVDIANISINDALKDIISKIQERDPYIQRIRLGYHQEDDSVRIVFDLKTDVIPQIFTLAPVMNFQNRLVIDLYPAKVSDADDPLMALLRDYREGRVTDDGSVQNTTTQPIKPLPNQTSESTLLTKDNSSNSKNNSKTSTPASNRKHPRQITVMLDPGHGGSDPGAISSFGLYEKHVALSIARKTKRLLEQKGYHVLLTRNEDVFIPLSVRVAKARQAGADVFASIHADSFSTPEPRGTGVYILNTKGKSEMAQYLAKTQNASDIIGGVSISPDPLINNTLVDMAQTVTIKDSHRLGEYVLDRLGKINKLHKGHVDGAAFRVLKAPDIPSILVETAFISNPQEAQLLNTNSFRDKLARAISDGINDYLASGVALTKR